MADFFQTPGDLPLNTGVGTETHIVSLASAIENPSPDDVLTRTLAPVTQYSPASALSDGSPSTPVFSPLVFVIETEMLPVNAQATFLAALLAAQQELSRGPRYPLLGQRWPWKSFG